MNRYLKDEFLNNKDIYRFNNTFDFLNFCFDNQYNTENSITYYDGEYMYIRKKYENEEEILEAIKKLDSAIQELKECHEIIKSANKKIDSLIKSNNNLFLKINKLS